MGAAMGISMAAQGGASIGGAYAQSQALRSQANYQEQVGRTNSQLSDIKAQDALQRGDEAATRNQVATRGLIGTQRADLAAQGIDVNSGSASDVQASSSGLGALDSLNIKNNAWREAWGYKVQGMNDTFQGQFEAMSERNAASETLMTGGMRAVSDYGQAGYYYHKG